MKLRDAQKACRELGFTLVHDKWDGEYAVYLKGEGKDWPATHFTNDIDDAVSTAQAMHEHITKRCNYGYAD